MNLRRLAICCALTAQVACANAGDPAGGVESLLETDHEFARYSREHGAAAAFDRYLTDDAIQLPDRGEVIHGRAAIVDGLRALEDGWVLDWVPVHAEVSGDGSMGWTWGRYEFYRAATPEAKQLGKYLNVWRLDADGRWRVAADIGNQAPPVPD